MPSGQTATVVFDTTMGKITIKVQADLGPNAAGAFVALARCGYYNNVMFHRIAKNFVIQAGDGQYARWPVDPMNLANMGTGGPQWHVKDDAVKAKYTVGTVAMARTSEANSGSSQFFIVTDPSAEATLAQSNNYAIFGNVTPDSLATVNKIASVPTGGPADANGNPGEIPTVPVVILNTTVTTP